MVSRPGSDAPGEDWTARVERLLWPAGGLRGPMKPLRHVLQYCWALGRDLAEGQLTLRAMGLVYVTLLSLVPALAISFFLARALGLHREIEPLLFEALEPLGSGGAEIAAGIIQFVENAQGTVLAGVGAVVLLLTTLSMSRRVEGSFNYVWRVAEQRHLGRRLLDHVSVLLIGPVVMAVAMGLITSLESSTLARQAAGIRPLGEALSLGGRALPYVLVCAAFSLSYWLIPNTRVRAGAALVGGIAGGLLWALAGSMFARFVVTSAQTITIYSTSAVAITALVWVYVCWLTLLIGAQVSFYWQNPACLHQGARSLVVRGRAREELALAIMLWTSQAVRAGARPLTRATLDGLTGLPDTALASVLEDLVEAGLLVPAGPDRFLPAGTPEQTTLLAIVDAVRETRRTDLAVRADFPDPAARTMAEVRAAMQVALGGRTVADLLEPPAGNP